MRGAPSGPGPPSSAQPILDYSLARGLAEPFPRLAPTRATVSRRTGLERARGTARLRASSKAARNLMATLPLSLSLAFLSLLGQTPPQGTPPPIPADTQ